MSEAQLPDADRGRDGVTSVSAPIKSHDATVRPRILLSSWYPLTVLVIINFFSFMDRTALAILLQAIKVDLHLNDQQLGLLSGLAFAAFYCTLGLPLAWLADRTSRVKLLSACLALWSVMTALSGAVRNYPQLFLTRMGVGVGEAGCLPPAHSLISDYFPRERRVLAITIFQAGAALGGSMGLFLIGAIGQHLGWRASLQVVGLAGVPIALLSILTLREPPRPHTAQETKERPLQTLAALLRRPAFVHLTIAYSVGTICTMGITQWMPTFLIRSFGMGMAQVGAWYGLASGISSVLGLLFGGSIATWLAPRDARWELWLPIITYIASAPLFVLMVLSPTPLLALVLKALATFFSAIGGGLALAAVHSFAESYRRATAISIVVFLSSVLGMGLGPYVIGALSDLLAPSLGHESLRYALLVTCVMLAWAIGHFVLAARRSVKDRVN
jgi:MFS family permease